jgi:excisionase family DNA binding protein
MSSRLFRNIEAADPVFNYYETAEYLGLSFWTVRRLVAQRKIQTIQLSPRRVGFRLSELKRYLGENVREAV